MRNFGKFISKHLFIYLSVIILIVGFDLLLFFLTFNGTVNSISENNPVQRLEKVSNNLTIQDGKYILNNRCQKDLITNNIWGIVIDNSGNVIWQYNLPEEIPLKYSLQDVATFSKLELCGHHILLTHGHYYYVTLDTAMLGSDAGARGFDIVLYGHTHRPKIEERGGVILANPGSVAYPRQEGRKPSYIIMKLERMERQISR